MYRYALHVARACPGGRYITPSPGGPHTILFNHSDSKHALDALQLLDGSLICLALQIQKGVGNFIPALVGHIGNIYIAGSHGAGNLADHVGTQPHGLLCGRLPCHSSDN